MTAVVLAFATLAPLIAANIAAARYARPYRHTPKHRKDKS